jgi:hypothetical protein
VKRLAFGILIAFGAIAWTFFYPAERIRIWLARRRARR